MLESDDLVGLGMAAHKMRLKKNDPRVVTYQIDRNINYTNFCTEYCSFCAFYRPLGAKDGYILPFEEIYKKIDEMLELGGTGILMQAALQQDSRATELQHLVDFLVNLLEGQDVAVFRAERAVERAERTIFGAEIRIVDVAVDLVSDHPRIVFLQTHFVRGHAEADEVVGFEHFERLLFG